MTPRFAHHGTTLLHRFARTLWPVRGAARAGAPGRDAHHFDALGQCACSGYFHANAIPGQLSPIEHVPLEANVE